MRYTENYRLPQIELEDNYDIEHFNDGWRKTDEELKRLDVEVQNRVNYDDTEIRELINETNASLDNIVNIIEYNVDYMLKFKTLDEIVDFINNKTEKCVFKFGFGNYEISKQLKLNSNVSIKGEGIGFTTLNYTGSISPCILIEDSENSSVDGFNIVNKSSSVVNGIEIKTTNIVQSGSTKINNVKIERFYNGIYISKKVFTLDIDNVRIYSCDNYGFFNNGTDNQFSRIKTVGNKGGNFYKGNNNVYTDIYSIYDGKTSDFSNKFTGHRNVINGFTCQDSRNSLVFDDFKGSVIAMFDGFDGNLETMPTYYIQLISSVLQGELNIASYQGGHQTDKLMYIDNNSVFIGNILPNYELTGGNDLNGAIVSSLKYNNITNPLINIITNMGYKYEYDEISNIVKISRNSEYQNTTFGNFILPNENSVWCFTGEIRKSENCMATKLVAFNNSGKIEPFYGSKTLVKSLSQDWQKFTITISRKTQQIGLTIDGMNNDVNGYVEIKNLKAIDITDSWVDYSFSICPIVKF